MNNFNISNVIDKEGKRKSLSKNKNIFSSFMKNTLKQVEKDKKNKISKNISLFKNLISKDVLDKVNAVDDDVNNDKNAKDSVNFKSSEQKPKINVFKYILRKKKEKIEKEEKKKKNIFLCCF